MSNTKTPLEKVLESIKKFNKAIEKDEVSFIEKGTLKVNNYE